MPLFCLGVFLLLAHVYAPIQIGPLDGSETESAEPSAYSLIELALLAAVIWIFIQLCDGPRPPHRRRCSRSPCSSSASAMRACWRSRDGAGADPAARGGAGRRPPRRGAPDIAGNVYHIVLDRDADRRLPRGSRELAARPRSFDGFDLFENNIANYISTLPSSASYLSGTLYKSGDYKSWVRGWHDRGLFATVADRGYETFVYAPFDHWDDRHIDHFRFNIDIYEEADRRCPCRPARPAPGLAGEPRAQSADQRGAAGRGAR